MVTKTLMTADELLAMPDDGHRYELIEGELVRMAPADFDSSHIGGLIVTFLNNHVRPRRLGIVAPADAGVRLASNPDTILSPDATFVRRDRLPEPNERHGYWRVTPNLVVEVASPTDRRREVLTKVERYLDLGVMLVVVVWPPTRTLTLHRSGCEVETLGEHDVFDGGDVVPGFRMPVADLFVEI
jgi:Uma2 family endonuclease